MLYETYKHTNTRAQHVDPTERRLANESISYIHMSAHRAVCCRHFEALAHQSVFISIGKAYAERNSKPEKI